ncbi:hypothetical protein [Microvirga sp. TS319]|uniref:hypothetical protein n=1 Tax=Microvirga sp. TS319 TaxID=3241165 RepID=UPI00351AA0B4
MRGVIVALALGLASSPMALAQSSTPSASQPPGNVQSKPAAPNSQAAPPSGQNGLITRQKLTQDLQSAGFSDVKVVEEAFVVQAKTRDGNPIVLTIGPNGMSAFEAVTSGPASTGSTGSSGSSSTNPNASGGATQQK